MSSECPREEMEDGGGIAERKEQGGNRDRSEGQPSDDKKRAMRGRANKQVMDEEYCATELPDLECLHHLLHSHD